MSRGSMKILQICSARELGGGERHFADLSNSLAARGHDVYAAVIPQSPLLPELRSLPRKNIFEIRMRNSLDVLSAIKLAGIVREFEIEVIHAHVARDYPLAAFASARSGNTPFVLTRHVLFPLNKIHKILLGRAAHVIAVSEAVAEALTKQGIFDPKKIATIHNGIDTKRFARVSSQSSDSSSLCGLSAPLIVGMAGHIAAIKGQEDFVRAAAIIAARRDDADFVIIGEDKSRRGENRAAIESLIAELGLTTRVHLVGWQDDVSQFLQEFDVFVSPSRSEPFGLAILEAMASGVAVVATASEGAIEIIEDGVTGRLVTIGDPESMAEAITNLLDDPATRERLSSNALQAVNQRFSLEQMVDATERLYGEVIKRDGNN